MAGFSGNDPAIHAINQLDDSSINNNIADTDVDFSLPLQQIVHEISRVLCDRLDNLESKVSSLSEICCHLGQKVDFLTDHFIVTHQPNADERCTKKIVKDSMIVDEICEENAAALAANLLNEGVFQRLYSGIDTGTNTKILTLNSEDDFPDGSWLGDENNPEMRIRCRIETKDLFLINTSHVTPEKMALALLGSLFDKETLATSNISGTGKHKKKQLDPLMICGIWCHLRHRFGISEKTWYKIRQSLDSKCRSAFRRAKKLSLKNQLPDVVDYEMSSNVSTTSTASNSFLDSDCDEPNRNVAENNVLLMHQNHPTLSIMDDFVPHEVMDGSEMVEVLEANPEQLAKLRDCGFQIFLDSPIITSDDLSS